MGKVLSRLARKLGVGVDGELGSVPDEASSMIVSVLTMRALQVSMTELLKNLRTRRAAFSSAMPDVSWSFLS